MKIKEPHHSADRLQTFLCLNIDQLSPGVIEKSLSNGLQKNYLKEGIIPTTPPNS